MVNHATVIRAASSYVRSKCDQCRQSFKLTQWYFILVNGRVTDTICQACYIASATIPCEQRDIERRV